MANAIEALRFYADSENWKEQESGIGMYPGEAIDYGGTAREALATLVWSDEWPTELGHYWAYGYLHCQREDMGAQLHPVEVRRIGSGVCYSSQGQLVFKHASPVKFMPMIVPKLPE
jgi:hypothetical protein